MPYPSVQNREHIPLHKYDAPNPIRVTRNIQQAPMTPHARYIHHVIDKCIGFSNHYLHGLQEPATLVPHYMIDNDRSSGHDDIVFWKPVPADISTAHFAEYENRIGVELPGTYKEFLAYKYFIDLNFGHNASFFRHTASWIEDFNNLFIEKGLQELLERGFIPFALNTDQGYFCFDTNKVDADKEYKIITCDKSFDEQEYPSINEQFAFIDLIKELEQSLDDWKQSKRNA